jgi:hypothetical protein
MAAGSWQAGLARLSLRGSCQGTADAATGEPEEQCGGAPFSALTGAARLQPNGRRGCREMDAVRACQRDWSAHMAELDELGYTLVPDIVPLCLAARVRAFSDDLLGAPDPVGQRRSKVHPIPGPVMAELASLPPLLSMAAHFCGCGGDDGSGALDLRLQEQVLIRTDHHSELEQPPGPTGWHIDFLFPPNSYESTPKKVYFQYFLHMSSTLPGGAAFCIVPRSHHRTIQAARQLRTPEERTTFRTNIAQNLVRVRSLPLSTVHGGAVHARRDVCVCVCVCVWCNLVAAVVSGLQRPVGCRG